MTATEEELIARHEARLALARCAQVLAERPGLIRDAYAKGIGISEIAKLLGMSRQHTSRLAHHPQP